MNTEMIWGPSGSHGGEANGNPLQYPCLENPMEGIAWQSTVHRAAKSQTCLKQLSMCADQQSIWYMLRV